VSYFVPVLRVIPEPTDILDACDRLIRSDHQASKILPEMPPLRLALKYVSKLIHRFTSM
jgi:hypothetical protein